MLIIVENKSAEDIIYVVALGEMWINNTILRVSAKKEKFKKSEITMEVGGSRSHLEFFF